ncbi:MAG: WecB/TagA/CpsF family glycosyltransferase [Ruminococcaceae bacterium]|nr:WecB/TagA/CpsF family glycosyltransferase [Oscillospiraceae bacterium]
MEKINVRGVLFDNVTLNEAKSIAEDYILKGEQCVIFTPNAEIVQMTLEDRDFKDKVNSADLIIPDGAGVVLASKILKKPLKCKVAGCELAESLVETSATGKYKIFFYGSKPETELGKSVAELAEEKMAEKYQGFKCAGKSHGYVKKEDMDTLIEKINSSGAEILFVCLGVPMQENWIYENRHRLTPSVIIGLGGTLDVFAGTVKRAPRIFVKLNLEWFYRLIKEPKRLWRMMKLPKFIFGTIFSKKEK